MNIGRLMCYVCGMNVVTSTGAGQVIYTIIILKCLSVSLSVALICGLYRPSSEPIALRNVLKCSTDILYLL